MQMLWLLYCCKQTSLGVDAVCVSVARAVVAWLSCSSDEGRSATSNLTLTMRCLMQELAEAVITGDRV